MKKTYYKRTPNSRECVETEVTVDGQKTSCVVDVQLLLAGVKMFPCGSGDDYRMTAQQRLELAYFVKSEREKASKANAVKTLAMWQDSGLDFEDFFAIGDKVADALITEYYLNLITPHKASSTCFQVGEPYSCEMDEGKLKNTYTTFHRVDKDTWVYDGHCFSGENQNRYTDGTALDRLIAEINAEIRAENAKKEV